MVNIGEAITHQVECNIFFKEYVEKVKIDICNLRKTEVILDMPQLAAYNPEIDWEKREVKMTRCLPICGKKKKKKKRQLEKQKRRKQQRNWYQGCFGSEKKEGVFIVKERVRGGASICRRLTVKRLYSTIEIAINIASTFCSQKR